jgi:hypothetical protein
VKCSGHSTGCDRCRVSGYPCAYTESRVGRVRGTRAKKKILATQDQRTGPERSSTVDSLHSEPLLSTIFLDSTAYLNGIPHEEQKELESSISTHEHFPELEDQLKLVNLQHSFHHRSISSPHRSAVPSSGPTFSSVETTVSQDSLDFGVEHVSPEQPPGERIGGTTTPSPILASPASRPLPNSATRRDERPPRDEGAVSSCVLAAAELISSLEKYIGARIAVVDILLGVARSVMGRMQQLVRLQQDRQEYRCLALFSVIMSQLIEMLETGCTSIVNEASDPRTGLLAQPLHAPPSCDLSDLGSVDLAFAPLGIDAEERRAWRTQQLVKELNHASELVMVIKNLAAIMKSSQGLDPSIMVEQGGCFAELEDRLRALRDKVTQRRNFL